MLVKWDDLKKGDFFTVTFEDQALIYQKVQTSGTSPYNAVLLNDGTLCNVFVSKDKTFNKIEVEFSIYYDS